MPVPNPAQAVKIKMAKMPHSFLLFSNEIGLPATLPALQDANVLGVVVASIRPNEYEIVREIAREHSIEAFVQPKAADPDFPKFRDKIAHLNPDFILSHCYSMRIPESIYRLARNGAYNIHWGRLPEYRGCSPTQWSIINGETITGVSLHVLEHEFDAGAVVEQRYLPLTPTDTWLDVHDRVKALATKMLIDIVPALLSGTAQSEKQSSEEANAWPRRTPEDGRFQWSQPAKHIYNLVRALVHPLPGAFVDEENGRLLLDNFVSLQRVFAMKAERLPFFRGDLELRPHSGDGFHPVRFDIIDKNKKQQRQQVIFDHSPEGVEIRVQTHLGSDQTEQNETIRALCTGVAKREFTISEDFISVTFNTVPAEKRVPEVDLTSSAE